MLLLFLTQVVAVLYQSCLCLRHGLLIAADFRGSPSVMCVLCVQRGAKTERRGIVPYLLDKILPAIAAACPMHGSLPEGHAAQVGFYLIEEPSTFPS